VASAPPRDQKRHHNWYHSTTMENGDRVVAVNVRLPAEVHASLVTLATDHKRSLQREIVAALRSHVWGRMVEHMQGQLSEQQRVHLEAAAEQVQAMLAPLQPQLQRMAAEVQRTASALQPDLERMRAQAEATMALLQPDLERMRAQVESVLGDPSVKAALANVQNMQQQLADQQAELRRLRDLIEAPDDEDDVSPSDSGESQT
jgi:hypothetical protein